MLSLYELIVYVLKQQQRIQKDAFNYLQNPSNIFDIVDMLISIHVAPSRLYQDQTCLVKVTQASQLYVCVFNIVFFREYICLISLTAKPEEMIWAVSSLSFSIFSESICAVGIANLLMQKGRTSALTCSGILDNLLVSMFIITHLLQNTTYTVYLFLVFIVLKRTNKKSVLYFDQYSLRFNMIALF